MTKETTPKSKFTRAMRKRTAYIIGGYLLGGYLIFGLSYYLADSNNFVARIFSIPTKIAGLVLLSYGCYTWAWLKNRGWGHMFWWILGPIGYIVLWKMKDNSETLVERESPLPSTSHD